MESFRKFRLAHGKHSPNIDSYCPLLIVGVFMLTNLDQECALRINLLTLHALYVKWPQSIYTVLFSESVKDVSQEPAVLLLLNSPQHHSSASLK